MRRNKVLYFLTGVVVFSVYSFFGVGDYIHAKSFDNEFDYPLNIDIKPLVNDILSDKVPSIEPINYYPYKFLTNSGKCDMIEKLDLFIVVKSAMDHFGHRNAIRQTYGQENFMPGIIVKILFFVGVDFVTPKSEIQMQLDQEMATNKDIIQMNFLDTYFNNTIKTMMSFRWMFEYCPRADFYLLTDDDMYISVSNLMDYVRDQTEITDNRLEVNNGVLERDKHLLAGYLFESTPQRYKSGKWHISLKEYPWDRWPPYVTAGAYVVSNLSMKFLYVGSLYVKHFRFDDIYIGIVARKVGIKPVHCPHVYYYKKSYSKEGYRNVIASHGYSDHEELITIWNEQNGRTLD